MILSSCPFDTCRILVVEDNEVNRLVVTQILGKLSCQTVIAVNGLEAVEAVKHAEFDLIFMDCQMPEMDGFEATRILRRMIVEGQIAPMVIIALTAHAMETDKNKCADAGMDDYLMKPFRKKDMEAMLQKWLRPAVKAV